MLASVFLMRVILPPLDIYCLFQRANFLLILSSTPSQNSTCWRAEFLLTSSLPNMFLFQPLIFSFITFSLVVNLKLALPLPPDPCHHPRRRSLKPSTLSHMFSNLNGEEPRLNPPPFSKMGKWSEVGLGCLLWTTPLN